MEIRLELKHVETPEQAEAWLSAMIGGGVPIKWFTHFAEWCEQSGQGARWKRSAEELRSLLMIFASDCLYQSTASDMVQSVAAFLQSNLWVMHRGGNAISRETLESLIANSIREFVIGCRGAAAVHCVVDFAGAVRDGVPVRDAQREICRAMKDRASKAGRVFSCICGTCEQESEMPWGAGNAVDAEFLHNAIVAIRGENAPA